MENSDGRYCGQAWSLEVFLLALIVLRLPGARQQPKFWFLFLALENQSKNFKKEWKPFIFSFKTIEGVPVSYLKNNS